MGYSFGPDAEPARSGDIVMFMDCACLRGSPGLVRLAQDEAGTRTGATLALTAGTEIVFPGMALCDGEFYANPDRSETAILVTRDAESPASQLALLFSGYATPRPLSDFIGIPARIGAIPAPS